MNQELKGQTAIVTGASRGIGTMIAERLASRGANIVINYLTNKSLADEVADRIRRNGGNAAAIQADMGKVADIEKLFKETEERFGRVDILVNSAGLGIMNPIESILETDYDRMFDINVKGSFFACQAAAKYMKDGGSIVNFSTSVLGLMLPAYALYAASKGAVEQFTRHLAKEFGPKAIRINAVAPGPVNTDFFNEGKSEEQIDRFKQMAAFGRLGEPDDVADVVLFLVSRESRWVTGQTLRINGGMT